MNNKSSIQTKILLILIVSIIQLTSCKENHIEKTTLPVISTTPVSEIRNTKAISGGNITSDGGEIITTRGMCWSTEQTPTTSDTKSLNGEGAGNFLANIIGLSPNTTYFIRAFATNINGTAYGNTVSFTTQQDGSIGSFTDPRDGNIYSTVNIGNQVWMAENLKYLPYLTGPDYSPSESLNYYVYDYYGNTIEEAKATTNYNDYGVLYNWTAAMAGFTSSETNPSGIQGACPDGWHLPSDSEWIQLVDYLGGPRKAGEKMKDKSEIYWYSTGSDYGAIGTNESGFTALPGGYRASSISLSFERRRQKGFWWSSTEWNNTNVIAHHLDYKYAQIQRDYYSKSDGYSIRCVKN